MDNQGLSDGESSILRSDLILENIQRMCLLSIWATKTMSTDFDKKHLTGVEVISSKDIFQKKVQNSYHEG